MMGSWDDDDNDDHVCAGVAAGVAELSRPVQHHALHLTHLTSEAADPRVEDELHLGPPRPRVARPARAPRRRRSQASPPWTCA